MVKEFLSQRGVTFREFDVSRDPAAAQEMISRTGQRGVPVTVIDGQVVVGFDRMRLEELLARQSQQRPIFGASIADTDKVKALYGSNITAGVYVGKVRSGSAAEKIGLAAGDIVLEINGRRLANSSEMQNILTGMGANERISLVVLRNGSTLFLEGNY